MNSKKANITVYDIAKAACVSPATVSRVLGNSDYPVAAQTRQKVCETAASLGYSPKSNPSFVSRNVMVVVPDLVNPYYTSLIAGLESSINRSNMNMLLKNSCWSVESEKLLLSQINPKEISGVIISPIGDQHNHISELIQKGVEVVIIEQSSGLECSKVCFDYEKGGELITQYLIDRGLRSIGFISSPLTRPSRRGVYSGYLRALERNHLPINKLHIRIANYENHQTGNLYEAANGASQIQALLACATPPQAVFCGNDFTAIGAMQQLQKMGLAVPKDLSVVGFDNIYYSGMMNPPLTTVDQCTYEMGSMAAELLGGNLANPQRKKVSVMLEPRLVKRESVI